MKALPFSYHKLIIGILSTASPEEEQLAEKRLEKNFGPIDAHSSRWNFTYTSYYDNEMGHGIERYFLSFQQLIDPQLLPDVKKRTNELEREFMHSGKRKINMDPGIISPERLILATAKDRGHRIPLRDGIFGEVTLMYVHGKFNSMPWTYADYRSEESLEFFNNVRILALEQRKKNLLKT